MKNKMRAMILMVALGSLGISPARAQQQPGTKDGKTKCACCEHKTSADSTDKKEATQHSGSAACCKEMKNQGTACCGVGGAKADSGKDAKADCCKEGKMDGCKEAANCCAGEDAKMCQTQQSGCAGSGQCPVAKATAK